MKQIFLGIGDKGKPVFSTEDTWSRGIPPHIQVVGTTGTGKGVLLGVIAAQCVRMGELVVWFDPKGDEWAPHVSAEAATLAGQPYCYLDLSPAAGAQINPLAGASEEQTEELFLAAFSLSEKGTDADFYRLADRQAATDMAAACAASGSTLTAADLWAAHGDELIANAPGFAGKVKEMASLASVNAKNGLDLKALVKSGGMLYVRGSMRNARVVNMQRMLLVRLVQLAEERDRIATQPRGICAILDEAKYHISRPMLEALGAAQGAGLHVILAHQALTDLRDCPADLDKDVVVGAVMENCALKLIYRVEDPLTAEWLARKSGRIQVEDETRTVTRNAGLAEIVSPERTIRQAERFNVDENMILNLRRAQAVVFGIGLPKFITTAPMRATKNPENLKTKTVEGVAFAVTADIFDLSSPGGAI